MNMFFDGSSNSSSSSSHSIDYDMTLVDHRFLQDSNSTTTAAAAADECEGLQKAEPGWFAVWYSIGVLYMFLALAIVCDEFFGPALEEMSSEHQLNLSMDVAGKLHTTHNQSHSRSQFESDGEKKQRSGLVTSIHT